MLILLLPVKAAAQDSGYPNTPLGGLSLPLARLTVTSSFGWRIHPVTGKPDFHRGVDLAARNDPVFSMMDGRVAATGADPILGIFIRIDHGDIQSIYGHLSLGLVQTGQSVLAGQPIGVTGSTGRSTGEHLHFSINFGDKHIHPLLFIKALVDQRTACPPLTQ
ncbi:MAG: M23 family metallopeptidase [Bacteroidota bacterium]